MEERLVTDILDLGKNVVFLILDRLRKPGLKSFELTCKRWKSFLQSSNYFFHRSTKIIPSKYNNVQKCLFLHASANRCEHCLNKSNVKTACRICYGIFCRGCVKNDGTYHVCLSCIEMKQCKCCLKRLVEWVVEEECSACETVCCYKCAITCRFCSDTFCSKCLKMSVSDIESNARFCHKCSDKVNFCIDCGEFRLKKGLNNISCNFCNTDMCRSYSCKKNIIKMHSKIVCLKCIEYCFNVLKHQNK